MCPKTQCGGTATTPAAALSGTESTQQQRLNTKGQLAVLAERLAGWIFDKEGFQEWSLKS